MSSSSGFLGTAGGSTAPKAVLQRHADARQSRWRLFPAALIGYFGLFLGPAVAGGLAAANAIGQRRYALAATMVGVGTAGWLLCPVLALMLAKAVGIGALGFVLLISRLFCALVGVWMALRLAPHVRGHEFLGGSTFPLLGPVLGATLLGFVIPPRILLVISGFWPLLLRS